MKNRTSKKPRLLVLSTDSTTHQLIPSKLRVAKACLRCRRRKRRCNGAVPCLFCQKSGCKCEYDKDYIAPSAAGRSSSNTLELVSTSTPPSPSPFSRSSSSSQLVSTSNASVLFEPRPKVGNRKGPRSVDYKKIVETMFTDSMLSSIQQRFQTETDPRMLKEYLLSLLQQNLKPQRNMLQLNNLLSNNTTEGQPQPPQEPALPLPPPPPQQQQQTLLPPRDFALRLILKAWNNACTLMRFYHRPTVVKVLDSIYAQGSHTALTPTQESMQPLIFAVLAVGALFSKDDFHQDDYVNRQFYNSESLKYFNRAKELIDLREIPDTNSLQALFMMSIFLRCCADLKGCYYYIGIAERVALAMELHRKSSLVGPSQIEDECRKRLFWSIHKVDIYMNCILGLPCNLSEDMVDQELPLDIDDDRITAESYWSVDNMPYGDTGSNGESGQYISSCGVNNEHTKLILIMSRIYRKFYSLNLAILQIKEREIVYFEKELEKWHENIPPVLKQYIKTEDVSNMKSDNFYLRPGKLLLFDFLLTKLVLYKPFFHFITIDIIKRKSKYLRFQVRMAHNCIDISKDIIDVSSKVVDEGLLNGSYWCFIHTIFYSVAILTVYKFLLERKIQKSESTTLSKGVSHEVQELEVINKYSEIGYKVLIYLKKTSIASDKIFHILGSMVNEFNEKTIELSHQITESPNVEDDKDGGLGTQTERDGASVDGATPGTVAVPSVLMNEGSSFVPGPSTTTTEFPSTNSNALITSESGNPNFTVSTQLPTSDILGGGVADATNINADSAASSTSPFTDTGMGLNGNVGFADFQGGDSLNELLFDPEDFLEKLSGYLEI